MEQEKKHKLTKEELIVILQNKREELDKVPTKKKHDARSDRRHPPGIRQMDLCAGGSRSAYAFRNLFAASQAQQGEVEEAA